MVLEVTLTLKKLFSSIPTASSSFKDPLLKELAVRIHEDEKALEGLLQESLALNYVRSLPGMGPILAAVVVSEIDGIERLPSAQKPPAFL